ncbi:MAG: twin-arginine translocation signal domain-containing protein [Pseudomonadota bacterium]
MSQEKDDASRRDFLKLATAAAPAAAVLTATGGQAAAAEEVVETSGLRKTEHVKTYLETARF